MTTGDYVLWFGALLFLLISASTAMNFLKLAQDNTKEWGVAAFSLGCFYIVLAIIVIAPTYYLVGRN